MFLGNITVPILLYRTTLLIINREEFAWMAHHAVCQMHKPAAGMILRILHYYKCESNEDLVNVKKLGPYVCSCRHNKASAWVSSTYCVYG